MKQELNYHWSQSQNIQTNKQSYHFKELFLFLIFFFYLGKKLELVLFMHDRHPGCSLSFSNCLSPCTF